MNETHHNTTESTPIELHLNKKPKRARENCFKFPPRGPESNYERTLEIAKNKISKSGSKEAEHL